MASIETLKKVAAANSVRRYAPRTRKLNVAIDKKLEGIKHVSENVGTVFHDIAGWAPENAWNLAGTVTTGGAGMARDVAQHGASIPKYMLWDLPRGAGPSLQRIGGSLWGSIEQYKGSGSLAKKTPKERKEWVKNELKKRREKSIKAGKPRSKKEIQKELKDELALKAGASPMLRTATMGATAIGTHIMFQGAQRAAEEQSRQLEETGTFNPELAKLRLSQHKFNPLDWRQYKTASKLDPEIKANIPEDTSKPTSQSPLDGMDNFDYQEWVTTKGNTYPEREETELNYFDNPRKVAMALGLDDLVEVIDDVEKRAAVAPPQAKPTTTPVKAKHIPTERGIKFDIMKFKDIKNQYGSKYIGAALLAAGIPTILTKASYDGMTGQPFVHLKPTYMTY